MYATIPLNTDRAYSLLCKFQLNFSTYYSRIAFHNENHEISDVLLHSQGILQKVLWANNKNKPEYIVLYKDVVWHQPVLGSGGFEIPQTLEAIHKFDPE